jgi:hypothetical protein
VSCNRVAAIALLVLAVGAARAPTALAVTPAASTSARAPRAPSQPPLSGVDAGVQEEGSGSAAADESDPLVSNGLGSPSCKGVLAGELSAPERSHCETSGFVAAPAPTGDYGIDVHIDTGLLGLSYGSLLSAVQDLFVTPLWMALVWTVHALIVMLEWCFEIDLLDSSAAGGLASGLRQAQASFTDPWLPLVLAVASAIALYQGLIRRRVAETLAEALVMGAMMAGGIWVIADPTGTIGALAAWTNQASLGTLAAAASGNPSMPGRALDASLGEVFEATIEGPWCYLEFGDVSWCADPTRLDATLRSAGLAIAASEASQADCRSSSCAPTSSSAQTLAHSAELLRDARSNGAIFLALPANGPARNSINDPGSLLHTLCQANEATGCRGPTAAQAEFRTGAQTWARVGGRLLIVAGVLGLLLLLGFVALHLLAAAIFSLLYLLLAPAMVLAPAFGEDGRALFRSWGAKLLGAVVSKLLFSFLLGVLLAVLTIISHLNAIGWWTQWLLMSAFWWGAYARRHRALGVVGGAIGAQRAQRRSVLQRVNGNPSTRNAHAALRWMQAKRIVPAPDATGGRDSREPRTLSRLRGPTPGAAASGSHTDPQASRMLRHEHRDAEQDAASGDASEQRMAVLRGRIERVRTERIEALAGGDWRRAHRLAQRGERLESEHERDRGALDTARGAARTSAADYVRARLDERTSYLDAQAALPASSQPLRRPPGAGAKARQRRDYPGLAGLAGYSREGYERADPRTQRQARLEIDRELETRNELRRRSEDTGARLLPVGGELRVVPASPREVSPAGASTGSQIDPALLRAARESSVMRDAREVAAGRKRQLGRDKR